MGIKNGDLPDADNVMDALGKMFKNQAQLIFNADLIGLDSDLDEEYENLKRDALNTATNIDTTNSDIDDVPIFGANVMDDFEDASIDGNIWSQSAGGGTITESSGKMNCTTTTNATTYVLADQVNAEDFNRAGTIFVKWDYHHGSTAATVGVYLEDESANSVALHVTTTGTATNSYRFEVTPAGNNVQKYADFKGTGAGTAVDVSALQDGEKWYIKLLADSTGTGEAGYYIYTYFVRHLSNSAVSKDFISSATTASETITDAILVVNKTINTGSSATYYLSADNGANYEAVTLNEVHRFTNTGTQLKVKITMSNSASDEIYELNHYAIWYNTEAV